MDESFFSLYSKFKGIVEEDEYVETVKAFIESKIKYNTGFEKLIWEQCKFPFKEIKWKIVDGNAKEHIATSLTKVLGYSHQTRNHRVYSEDAMQKAMKNFVGVDISTKDSDKTACLVLSPRMIGDKVVAYSIVGRTICKGSSSS